MNARQALRPQRRAAIRHEALGLAALACALVWLPGAVAQGEARFEAAEAVDDFEASAAESLVSVSALRDPLNDVALLPRSFPALEVHTPFVTDPNLYIRGLGQQHWYDNFTGPVAIYQDGVYATSSAGQLLEAFDLADAAVPAGPQGSLYARNATVGALLLHSKLPDGEYSSRAGVSYGNYEAVALDGALAFPIVEGLLSGRIAGTAHFRNGVTRNKCRGAQAETGNVNPRCDLLWNFWPSQPGKFPYGALGDFDGLERWTNDVRDWAGRGLLRLTPGEGQDWVLKIHGARNRSDSRHLQMVGTLKGGLGIENNGVNSVFFSEDSRPRFDRDPFVGWYDQDGDDALDRLGASLTGRVDLGAAQLVSITAYWRRNHSVEDEGDAMPSVALATNWSDETWQISQDVHLEDAGTHYSWRLGGELLYEDGEADNLFKNVNLTNIRQSTDQSLLSFAPYAHGRWDVSPRFALEIGARFVWEQRRFGLDSQTVFWNRSVLDASLPADDPARYASRWDACCAPTSSYVDVPDAEASNVSAAPTGELRLHFMPSDDVDLYLQFTQGYKGAQFYGESRTEEQDIYLVQPEFARGGEAGVRSVWLDGALGFDAAVFYTQYQGLQVFDVANEVDEPSTRRLLNADARAYGVDASFTARPLPGLYTQVGFGWLDAEYQDFNPLVQVRPRFKGQAGRRLADFFDYSGNPLVGAPRFRLAGRADYAIDLGRFGTLTPGMAFRYRSLAYFSPAKKPEVSQPGYWVLDAQASWRLPGERIEIGGFARNFLNEQYRTDIFDQSIDVNQLLYVYADPRLFGGGVSFLW